MESLLPHKGEHLMATYYMILSQLRFLWSYLCQHKPEVPALICSLQIQDILFAIAKHIKTHLSRLNGER